MGALVPLDRTEKEIIRSLQKDGRMSFVDMAERVGVTEGTIRRKFYRLVDEGVLQIGAITDPFMVGFKTPAVIGLNVDTERIGDVVKALSTVSRIRQLMLTTGIFDIIMVGYFSSNRELARFITDELSQIEGITDTNTSVVLEIFKDSFEVGLPANMDDD